MNENKEKNFFQRYPITLFFTLCYLIGFLILIPLVLFEIGILALIAASSASIAGILTAYITKGKQGIKDLFSGFRKWRHKPVYYIPAIFIPLIIILIAIGISSLFGNPYYSIEMGQWAAFFPMFLFITIQAGLGEELGWRGYANPKLAENNSALKACLIIGVAWAFWHLPLYFFPGMMQYKVVQKIGFFNMFLWYSIFIIAAAVVFGWIYYVSDGNLWLPVLMHGSLNAFGWLFAFDNIDNYGGPVMIITMIIVWVIFAAIITLIYGPKKLKRTKLD